jgi:hypothetical protein
MELAKLVLEYLKALAWPATTIFLGIYFREPLTALLDRIKKAGLPGGVSLDFQEKIQEVKELSEEIPAAPNAQTANARATIPLTEANARMISLGLQPVSSGLDLSYFRHIAQTDPTLALAGLRIELETLARNLAIGYKLETKGYEPPSKLLNRLHSKGLITSAQADLGKKILIICNKAVHGQLVSASEAQEVIDAAGTLFENFLQWLSWGFDDNWQPKNPAAS